MAPTQADFVRAVMAHLNLTQTELGIALGKGNAYQTVHGWLDRKRLGYTDTMRMLELCGWLNMRAAEPTTSPEAREPADPREETRAQLAMLTENLEAVLDALGVPESERKRLVLSPKAHRNPGAEARTEDRAG